MDLLLKTVAAFCIGIGAMWGVQTLYVKTISEALQSDKGRMSAGMPEFKSPFNNIDGNKLREALQQQYKPIDTTTGQRLGVESAQRRMDQIVRGAQNAVPVQRSYPGVPRY